VIIDLAKLKVGELVVVNSQARSARGLYLVTGKGAAWFKAVPVDTFNPASEAKLLATDIVAHFPAAAVNAEALPASRDFDLDTPRRPKLEPPAPKPEPPTEFLLVSVPNPARRSYEMVRFRTPDRPQQEVHMDCLSSAHLNRYSGGRSRLAIWVPTDLVERLLASDESNALYVIDPTDGGRLPKPEDVTLIKGGSR